MNGIDEIQSDGNHLIVQFFLLVLYVPNFNHSVCDAWVDFLTTTNKRQKKKNKLNYPK